MSIIVETQMTRVGTTNKPKLADIDSNVVVDFDEIDKSIPSDKQLRSYCEQWQISPNQHLTITEAGGFFCAARLFWLLTQSGFKDVAMATPKTVLNATAGKSTQSFNAEMLKSLQINGFLTHEQMQDQWQSNTQIVDVRSASRFSGEEADPRPGVRSGHIPNSINIHYGKFLSHSDNNVFISDDELHTLFANNNIDLTKPLIFSCGSGITACIGAVAASRISNALIYVYNGSWSKWGSDQSLPVATII